MFRLENPLPTCDPNVVPLVSSRVEPFTPRRAVDSSGRLGSFYDASRDEVLSKSTLQYNKKEAKPQCPPSCQIKPCSSEESKNLLKWYNIHHELRLSVALQLVQEMGIGDMMNYSHPIDEYTRLISYEYFSHTDYISDEELQWLSQNKMPKPDTFATHVIVMVNWGVHALAVLQLPADTQDIPAIDSALENLCASLENDRLDLSNEDERLLRKIGHTEVFSSISVLTKIRSVVGLHREIVRVKSDRNLYTPYNYNLCSIQTFYNFSSRSNIFIPLPTREMNMIENYLAVLLSCMKKFRAILLEPYSHLKKYLYVHFCEVQRKWSNLEEMHMQKIQKLCNLVIWMRRGRVEHKMMDEALNDNESKTLLKHIDNFSFHLDAIQEKEYFIGDLLQKYFEYRNAADYDIKCDDDQGIIERKLRDDVKYDRVIRFSDILIKQKRKEWNELVDKTARERTENSPLKCLFLDFSYCPGDLKSFAVIDETKRSSAAITPEQIPPSPRKQSMNDGTINILLLGESGVGKSTFINALANYLAFETLQQAEKKPISLMPVSFIITVGDNFEEKTVTFNMQDDLNNEDFTQAGQSVTQHCKSYVFTLTEGENRGRKIRIIDTPGIGDVRGLAQDDINMQHVLLYITNLTHLNAVCLLMKPNHARLNIFLRSGFVQLFDLLGESARDRMIFCFTNSRSTFYTPGDSGPLVKQLLKSLLVSDILFNKTNTFCFDSESFRYLVAKRNIKKFSESEEQDYQDSWTKSSTESKRFLNYICTKTTPSLHPGEVMSAKSAQLKIRTLVRPMLEAMRNTLRNIVLWEKESRTTSVDLCPGPLRQPTGICLKCPRQYVPVGDLWIVRDALHLFLKKCGTCQCSFDDHLSIDYRLDYKQNDCPENNLDKKLETTLDGLCETSAQFANFLMNTTEISKNDPFLSGIKRMINEESDICENKRPCDLNAQLLQKLQKLENNFKERISTQKSGIPLSTIYGEIEQANKHPLIKSQMNAARQWHTFMMKHYEYEV